MKITGANTIGPFNATEHHKRSVIYHPKLFALFHMKASGVYVIAHKRSKRVLYVGESHTGRLYDTITRHFRQWRIDPRDHPGEGRRRGGTTYDRTKVTIEYALMPASVAPAAQYVCIQQLKPRDNSQDCSGKECAERHGSYEPTPTDLPI